MKPLVLILALIMALPGPVLAEKAPKPRLKPAQGALAPAVTIPIPKPRPAPDRPAGPPPGGAAEAPETRPWPAAEVEAARSACAGLLRSLDIDHAPAAPIGAWGGCGAPAAVSVSRVAGVDLVPEATLTCDMAAALHGWVSGSLQPAARAHLKTDVTAIRTGTSYACRRRNNSSSGKMSEHSRANALDISGFTFAAREGVAVGGGNWGEGILAALGAGRDGSFLAAVRKGACAHFTTVLGPGSDPHHGDHFHMDVLRRKGGYRICQ